jgi:hypothetical protein
MRRFFILFLTHAAESPYLCTMDAKKTATLGYDTLEVREETDTTFQAAVYPRAAVSSVRLVVDKKTKQAHLYVEAQKLVVIHSYEERAVAINGESDPLKAYYLLRAWLDAPSATPYDPKEDLQRIEDIFASMTAAGYLKETP